MTNRPTGSGFLTESTGIQSTKTPLSDLTAFGIYLPEAHGAVGDATTNDTVAVQAAITACPKGGRVHLSKMYYCPGGVTVPNPTMIHGHGSLGTSGEFGTAYSYATGLVTDSRTQTLLTIQQSGTVLRDFALVNRAGSAPTAGAGLLAQLTNEAGNFTRINNVATVGFWNNVEFASGFYWSMTDSAVLDPVNYGVFLHNNVPSSDWGDMSIMGCTFTVHNSATNPAAAVRWESGGGLRFVNNKINGNGDGDGAGRFTWGIDCDAAAGISTVDLIVSANSIENCTAGSIRVAQQSTTGNYAGYTITGNQFGGPGYGVFISPTTGGNEGIAEISGNSFISCSTSIYAKNAWTVHVGENNHYNCGTLVNIDTGCLDVKVAEQNINGASGTVILLDPDGRVASDKKDTRDIGTITSATTYTPLYKVALKTYEGGFIDIELDGALAGGSSVCLRQTYSVTSTGPGSIIPTYQTSIQGGEAVDINWDTSTAAGYVLIGVRRNAGGAGTPLFGKLHIRCVGSISQLSYP